MAYRVIWEIDFEGEGDPEAAARWAWKTMRKPESTANVFTVIHENGDQVKVDLQEIDEFGALEEIARLPDAERELEPA
ncbi:hypothetical protein [Mesorhizobium sp.]|uniref:hypothetical protein n=1 Tax=Mesorhizobium sp. TaxID=1871066 RepID=UPI000FE89572|nr:hypothetical protein [Mesorhizobium sp.]RWB67565.1 MAG: hypothetical protein EOQ49_24920 [Mesorhizobium sp.]